LQTNGHLVGEIAIATGMLNQMLHLGRPNYVRIV
jgi:hypothetical protein